MQAPYEYNQQAVHVLACSVAMRKRRHAAAEIFHTEQEDYLFNDKMIFNDAKKSFCKQFSKMWLTASSCLVKRQ